MGGVVSDDERREVAERLRKSGKEFGDPTWRELCNVVFGGDNRFPTRVRKLHLIDRLADLIDPDCEDGRYEVARTARPVDREALLALAKGLCDGHPYGLCHGGLEQLACRIREACGVSE